MASTNGQYQAASVLLADSRIDINLFDRVRCLCAIPYRSMRLTSVQDSRTALHFAASAGHSQITQLLLAQDSLQPNIATLVFVHTASDPAVISYLLQDGRSPLHFASLNGHVLDAQALVTDSRVDVNLTDQVRCAQMLCLLPVLISPQSMRTALHYASEWAHVDIVTLLTDANADTNIQDAVGILHFSSCLALI